MKTAPEINYNNHGFYVCHFDTDISEDDEGDGWRYLRRDGKWFSAMGSDCGTYFSTKAEADSVLAPLLSEMEKEQASLKTDAALYRFLCKSLMLTAVRINTNSIRWRLDFTTRIEANIEGVDPPSSVQQLLDAAMKEANATK